MAKRQGQTFLVTGGAGFIGSHLIKALLTDGADVVVVDDFNDYYDPAIKEHNLASVQNDIKLYRADIRDTKALEGIFQQHGKSLQHGGIVHLAARAGVRPSLKEPRLYLETNVTGTLNLAEMAKAYEISRFIFASSSSVYGDSPETVPFKESQDVSHPISPYAATKVMGEHLLHSYSHLYGLAVTCLRFFTVYGAGQRPDLAIHKFTKLIDEGQPIPVFGDGSTRRDYTYIDDIIQGVTAGIDYRHDPSKTPFDIFNLGESQTTSLADLIAHIESAVGKKAQIDRQPTQPGDVSVTFADISKSRDVLGYSPQTQIAQGIPLFVEWYRAYKMEKTSTTSIAFNV